MTKPKQKTPPPIASEIGAFPDAAPAASVPAGHVSVPPAVLAKASETVSPKVETTAASASKPSESGPKPDHSEPVGYMLQPRLAGYRYLTERDAALINRVKAVAKDARELTEDLERYGTTPEDLQAAIQHLKIGFSLLTRSIAKPTEW